MIPLVMIVDDVLPKRMTERLLAEQDELRETFLWCLRCLLLVMCTYSFAKKAITLHLARGEGRERYFGCNLMQRKVLASSHQHLMAEAPIVKPTALVPVANTDTKFLIYGLFQKGRVLAQDGVRYALRGPRAHRRAQ